MSLFQTLNIGISGIQGQSNVISSISNNIANVSTVGYKSVTQLFRDLVISDSAANYSPGGASSITKYLNHAQGELFSTSSDTDIAIGGNGLFAVSQNSPAGGNIVYTRAGSFTPNKDGDFVNGAGFFLQGWLLDSTGNLPAGLNGTSVEAGTAIAAMQTVNVIKLNAAAIPTTAIALKANLDASQVPLANSTVSVVSNLNAAQLAHATANISIAGNLNSTQTAFVGTYDPTVSANNMASGAVPPAFSHTVSVIDNTGTTRTIRAGFLKTGPDTWAVEIYAEPPADVTQTDGQLAFGTVTFNPDGTLASASPALTGAITANWNNVGGPSNITFNFGTIGTADGLSQTDNNFAAVLTATPDYDPNVSGKSMASGAVAPDFSDTVSVLDNTGTARTLVVSYLKTGDNTWAVEVYGQPLSDVTSTGPVAGQVASGTITFNSAGALASVSPSLSHPLPVGWNGNGQINEVAFDWGTIGASTGLSQLSSAYTSTMSAVKNYDPASPLKDMASGVVQPQFSIPVTVVDSTGVSHSVTYGFLKTGINTWAVEVYATTPSDVVGGNPQLASGTITFNGDATLSTVSGGLSGPINVSWQDDPTTVGTNTFTVDWGTAGPIFGTPNATVIGRADGLSQFDGSYDITSVIQDGSEADQLIGVTIDNDGTVIGDYKNGSTRKLYKIPLAEFTDTDQLQSLTGNVFAQTNDSSVPLFFQADHGPVGKIFSDSLESSNVDLQSQLTDMIVAQRAYQANTKVVTVSDDMMTTATQMLG